MRHNHCLLAATAALSFMLAACGGSAGTSIATVAPPPPSPTPAPTPSAFGAFATPPDGVTATTDFAVLGADAKIRWDANLQDYEIELAGYPAGHVIQTEAGQAGASGNVVGPDGTTLFQAFAATPYRYTGMMQFLTSPVTYVAYGVATPAGGVPTVGNATFDAQIEGHADTWGLYGTAQFNFDFAAGTLSGFMDPHTNGPMESPPLPRYTFTETVFSAGSTTFSGKFDNGGSFEGLFTGPAAEELMAKFSAPFMDWDAQENPTVPGTIEGVMVGVRHQQ